MIIDQALIKAAIDAELGIDLAHENLSYKPKTGVPFAELKIIQNDVTGYSLANDNQTDGIFQFLLHYPANSGAVAAKAKADQFLAVFGIGQRITRDGVTVTIQRHNRMEPTIDSGWYKLPVRIFFRSFLTR